MEQTDSDQRRGEKEIRVERMRRDGLKSMYEWHMDMDNGVGIDCCGRGCTGEGKGGKLGQL